MTLRTKTSLLMSVFITVVLGTSGILYLNFLKHSLRYSILDGLESVSVTSSEAVSRFIEGNLRDAQAIAFALPAGALEQRDPGVVEEKFKALLEIFPDFDNGMFILDAKGELWADYPANLEVRGKPYAHREYFQRTMNEGKGIVGVPYVSSRINEPVLTFTAPLRDSSKEIVGVLGCSVRLLSARTAQVIRSTRIGKSGYIYLFDKSRLMILHPQKERVLQRDVPASANRLFDAAIEVGFQGVGETVNSRGVPMLAAVSQVSGTDWILVAQQPKDEAYAPIREATTLMFFGLALVIAVTVFATALIVRRVTAPLIKLRDAAVRFKRSAAEQDIGDPVETSGSSWELDGTYPNDEIGEVSCAFREMGEKLEVTLRSMREAATDWENTFDSVPDAIYLLDREHRILRVNRSAASLFGVEPEQAIGQLCFWLMHKTEAPPAYCPLDETLAEGKLSSFEFEDPLSGRFFRTMTSPLRDRSGTVIGAVHVQTDITERKQVEETLNKTKEMLQALIEAAPVAINVVDADGNIMMWNPASEQIFGWSAEEVLGRSHPLIPDDKKEEFLRLVKCSFEGEVFRNVETLRRRKDGTLVDVSVSTAPVRGASGEIIGALGIMLDITGRRRAEEERDVLESHLRQAHKMEAIGTLAGGIAHDFNNILGAILGYTEMTIEETLEGSRMRSNLDQVIKASLRAKDLVRQILAFSRQGETESKAIAVGPLAREALKLLRASLPSTIRIREDIPPNLGAVMADPTHIHQVLMNLCTNAAHAMSENGGLLEVTLNRSDVDPSDGLPHPDLSPGPYLRLTVRDTGHGMDQQTRERIFDPYFTTKEKGVGTGLGLAVVQGIVKSCGGAIGVESGQAEGATFHVFLPVAEQIAAPPPAARSGARPKGSAHILFVDDEAPLAKLGKQMLEYLGYRVTSRTSSIEALEAFRVNPARFDLVVTDTTMPNMTGVELIRELLHIRPATPIVLCTGFSDILTAEKAKAMGAREFLMKPLTMDELAQTIRRVLDEEERSEAAEGSARAR